MTPTRTIDAVQSHLAGSDAARRSGRRGVLLLIVLSMLTLFLMLGSAYLVAATRARTAARAHARLTFGGDEFRTPAGAMLDSILLRVLASGTSAQPDAGSLNSDLVFESLLADKFGETVTPLTGTATAVAITGPIVTATVSLNTPTRPTDLNGRVLSFVEPGRPATSHRIVRAFPSNNVNSVATALTLVLDRPFRTEGLAQPAAVSRVLINGREFMGDPTNANDLHEAWDGFDDKNPFLARVAAGSMASSSTTSRISYFPRLEGAALRSALKDVESGLPKGVDNDGDGGLDGLFLDWDLPEVTDANGNELKLEASVLVIDLDGRFNVNAHGSWASLMYPPNHAGWTTFNYIPNLSQVPLGSGYGSPEIVANSGQTTEPQSPGGSIPRLFDGDALQPRDAAPEQKENAKLSLLSGAAPDSKINRPFPQQRGLRPAGSRYTPDEPTPRLPSLQGKYGDGTMSGTAALSGSYRLFVQPKDFEAALPGFPGVDDPISRLQDRRLVYSSTTAGRSYGIPQTWWDGSPDYDWHPSGTSAPAPRGIYNSPPDVHGRMKTLTISGSAIVPQLVFAQPEWAANSISLDDPYELLLDTRRGVGGWLHDPSTPASIHQNPTAVHQNPFTLAEFEGVLRPYDIDSGRAPARLAALLGTTGESSRLRVTTESWDTTSIVGGHQTNGAARRLQDWLEKATGALYGGNPLQGVISGEASRWEKFDLNRALAPSPRDPDTASYGMDPSNPDHEYHVQRQAYFKDLYVLLVAINQGGGNHNESENKKIAQWVANAVEFRDADSRIIPFEYDVNPQDGWSVDGNVISAEGGDRRVAWGAERPEMLIQETLAWRKDSSAAGMLIAIHRPWNAKAYTSGTSRPLDAEPCDTVFDTLVNPQGMPSGEGRPSNQIDLGKKAHQNTLASGTFTQWGRRQSGEYPIWRLRLSNAQGAKMIRFDADTPTPGANNEIVASAPTPIGPDDSLVVYDSLTIERDPPQQPVTVLVGPDAFQVQASSLEVPSDWTGDITLHLERFSDPAHAPTKEEWDLDPLDEPDKATSPYRYIPVDSVPIVVIQTGGAGGAIMSTRRGGTDPQSAFWKSPSQQQSIVSNAPFPAAIRSDERDKIKWFPWPNRPYISAAELLLVPQGDSREILQQYEPLTPENQAARGVPVSLQLLFDAVHVPSRFPGVHSTTDFAFPPQCGVFPRITTINQMSAYREPGRVNINTITSEEVWNTVIAGPLPKPLVTGTQAGLGISAASGTSSRAVHSMLEALSLQQAGTTVSDDPEMGGTAGAVAIEGAEKNPLHTLYTATRLANTITTRSNMYAVWITLRESVTGDPDSAKLHRGFYIVDRSIPVGFEAGKDHNVWDCVRLRRVIE